MARPKGSGVIPFHERFEKFISPEPNTGCWIWTGSTSHGYGQIFFSKELKIPIKAHVYSYEYYKKEKVQKGMDVCHKCDNRWCVNPEHLFVGTRKDNMQDCKRKGRTLFGEKNSKSKLTQKQADEIKILLKSDIHKNDIAKKYGVSWATVNRIWRGTHWYR